MAKSTKTKNRPDGHAHGQSPTDGAASEPAHVTEDDIARRAYDRYLARGREDGHDIEDWLHAEQEVRRVRAV